jgi:tRNA pseudouridine55 synthase
MNPMNGLLLIDKPEGLTSHDVVYRARRTLGLRAIGHAGTLDPLASGLLILLLGEATKISDYLLNGDKTYELKARLGIQTDSMDMTGKVLREAVVDKDVSTVRSQALALSGVLNLQVPLHSAVKVDGKKLYEFAHKGEAPTVEIPFRDMTFHEVDVVEVDERHLTARLKCSKGSFIRAWANHLGEKLGFGATVEALRRIESAPFTVSQAIALDDIESKWEARIERHGSALGSAWVPLRDSLPHFVRIDVSGQDEKLLKNGQISKMLQSQLLQHVQIGKPLPGVRVISRETDDLLAVLLAEPGEFYKIKRVFHSA